LRAVASIYNASPGFYNYLDEWFRRRGSEGCGGDLILLRD